MFVKRCLRDTGTCVILGYAATTTERSRFRVSHPQPDNRDGYDQDGNSGSSILAGSMHSLKVRIRYSEEGQRYFPVIEVCEPFSMENFLSSLIPEDNEATPDPDFSGHQRWFL